jgi:hypothetical protein
MSPPFTTMAVVAEQSGALSSEDAHTWLAQLADAGDRGQFFWAVTMFTVAGARPPVTTRQATERSNQ